MGFNSGFKGLKSVTRSVIMSFITIFTLCMWFPHIAIDLVFVLDMVMYFLAIRFRWYAIVCRSSSDVTIKIWSSAYSIVFTNFLLFSMHMVKYMCLYKEAQLKSELQLTGT